MVQMGWQFLMIDRAGIGVGAHGVDLYIMLFHDSTFRFNQR